MIWVFLVVFPILLGASTNEPVVVRIESKTAEQCHRVRKLLIKQLEDHRSNATTTYCALGVATVVPE